MNGEGWRSIRCALVLWRTAVWGYDPELARPGPALGDRAVAQGRSKWACIGSGYGEGCIALLLREADPDAVILIRVSGKVRVEGVTHEDGMPRGRVQFSIEWRTQKEKCRQPFAQPSALLSQRFRPKQRLVKDVASRLADRSTASREFINRDITRSGAKPCPTDPVLRRPWRTREAKTLAGSRPRRVRIQVSRWVAPVP